MEVFRIRLRLESSLSGPVQGDTLFGLVCTDMALREGESAVAEFLASVDSGEKALVFSNGFPEGCLPMPLLEPGMTRLLDRAAAEEGAEGAEADIKDPRGEAVLVKTGIAEEHGGGKKAEKPGKARAPGGSLEDYAKLRRLEKLEYLPADILLAQKPPLGIETIKAAAVGPETSVRKSSDRLHASIDRITGRSLDEGGLYSTREYWRAPRRGEEFPKIDIYAVSTEGMERVRLLVGRTLEGGYGADASTGKGSLALESVEIREFPDAGNRFLALGNFVPGPKDVLPDLRAEVMTKFGKTGPGMALGGNPFKKPVIMYREGANFAARQGPAAAESRGTEAHFIGCLLSGLHPDARIRQHAFAPVLRYEEA